METPICVIDAATLVEHIHEIKAWIYSGQLRLVVPQSVENVDQIYQKSVEPKPAAKEAPKAKTFGRPTKKEHPTFDTNPRVAKAFLERVKTGKDYETGHLGRPIYEEEEKHGAVHFPKANEQYTQWKDIEEYEEKTESPADGQASWADKLRKKPGLVNGTTNLKLPKGPVKPKLVAKSGVDNSPWKVQRNAPTISATEVPNVLRPMMSFALWRIHESIHRNDENQLVVLTDQQNVRDVAEKLNIIVRSEKQLRDHIASRSDKGDVNAYGDLERDFGARPIKERAPVKTPLHAPIRRLANGLAQNNGVQGKEEEQHGEQRQEESLTTGPTMELRIDNQANSGNIHDIASFIQTEMTLPTVKLGIGSHLSGQAIPQMPTSLARDDDRSVGAEKKAEQSALTLIEDTILEKSHNEGPSGANSAINIQSQPSTNNIWSRSFADALTGNTTKKTSPVPIADTPPRSEESRTPNKSPVSPSKLPEQVVAPSRAAEEPEDSEEEVVVFQPKCLSAQKKPAQHSSRPTTPNVQSQQSQAAQGLVTSALRNPVTPNPMHHTPKVINVNGHLHPRPSSGPLPVIDPDAFGRGFAVNTNPLPHGTNPHGMRSHHSPQSSVKTAVLDTSRSVSRPSSSHRQPCTSPARESPKASPQQVHRTPMATNESMDGTKAMQLPIGTGRPSPGPTADLRTQMINAPVFQPAGVRNPTVFAPKEQSSKQISHIPAIQAPIGSGRPSSKTSQQPANVASIAASTQPSGPFQQDPDFIRGPNPRASAPFQRQDPQVSRNSRVGASRQLSPQQYVARPGNPSNGQTLLSGPQSNRHAPTRNGGSFPRPRGGMPRPVKPSLFEPSLDHTREYQPETSEPLSSSVSEVQYILKSGSTREQARGKGKLWVG